MTGNNYYNDVIGNVSAADRDAGFRNEIKAIFESYTQQGTDLTRDMGDIINSPSNKQSFISALTESMGDSALMTNPSAANAPFYHNYVNRVDQLMQNTLDTIATESVMTGYAPIVAYNPFFLKKQWIACVLKDVLMTEIPKTPVINMAFEKRYLRDAEGKEYPLPESLYDDELVAKLHDAATGLNIKEDPIPVEDCKNLQLIDPTYIPGVIKGDANIELTPNLIICAVVMKDGEEEYTVPVQATVDVTTHNFVNGHVRYDLLDTDGKTVTKTLEDELIGRVDFKNGTITVASTTGVITKICLRGKTANRYNERSLDVVRRVDQIQKVMPESGPRLNSSITIEEASDALALQKIDVIADNINVMGATLAELEDAEIKAFLLNSFEAQKAGASNGILYNELRNESMIAEVGFDTMPYEQYSRNISEWMKDSREYFERLIGALKMKLRTSNLVIVAVANPNLIRFLQDGISWVFSDDTQISGVKLEYNFGVYTSAQDRVHILTSMRFSEADGIRFVVIPLTQELVTFKHFKYNVVIDRNYRNPVHSLTPNIMCTQRTLTFEVLPVAGKMSITGREMFSPETLKRAAD